MKLLLYSILKKKLKKCLACLKWRYFVALKIDKHIMLRLCLLKVTRCFFEASIVEAISLHAFIQTTVYVIFYKRNACFLSLQMQINEEIHK